MEHDARRADQIKKMVYFRLPMIDPSTRKRLESFLQHDNRILFAYLFGSQTSGAANPMSDIDVAIYTQDHLSPEDRIQLLSELMEPLGTDRVDLVDLRNAPPALAYEVVASGQTLFIRDPDAQNRFERRALLHYFDTQHLRDVQNQYLRDHLRAS